MSRILTCVAAVLICVISAAGFLVYVHAEPSTGALDTDIAKVRVEVKAADDDAAQYNGGMIRVVIEMRRQVLLTTQAMLEQKRHAFLRRIDLRYSVDGKSAPAAPEARLQQIAGDLKRAEQKEKMDEIEAARYSGGLVQAMTLVTVATDRLSIAQLDLAYYGAKYGIPLPTDLKAETKPATQSSPPGKVANDKDAL